MDEEKFKEIEYQYGCGYWHVCDDHSCPCSPTSAVGQGFNLETYESLKRQCQKDRENLDLELLDERSCSKWCRDWDDDEEEDIWEE